jgi:hypothetical protein
MGMMGQGLSEAGANIGRSLQSGYQNLGQGLASGISAAASVYAQHKELKDSNKAYENLIKNPKTQQMLGISKDQANAFLKNADELGASAKGKMFETFFPAAIKQSLFSQGREADIEMAGILSGYKQGEDWNREEIRRDRMKANAGTFINPSAGSMDDTYLPGEGDPNTAVQSKGGPKQIPSGASPLIRNDWNSLSAEDQDYLKQKGVGPAELESMDLKNRGRWLNTVPSRQYFQMGK